MEHARVITSSYLSCPAFSMAVVGGCVSGREDPPAPPALQVLSPCPDRYLWVFILCNQTEMALNIFMASHTRSSSAFPGIVLPAGAIRGSSKIFAAQKTVHRVFHLSELIELLLEKVDCLIHQHQELQGLGNNTANSDFGKTI